MVKARYLVFLKGNPPESETGWFLHGDSFITTIIPLNHLTPGNPGAVDMASEEISEGWNNSVWALLICPAAVAVFVYYLIKRSPVIQKNKRASSFLSLHKKNPKPSGVNVRSLSPPFLKSCCLSNRCFALQHLQRIEHFSCVTGRSNTSPLPLNQSLRVDEKGVTERVRSHP